MPQPEIVAPAGNFSKLKTAVLYGADTVYFSGQKYGLRMGADNFSLEEIEKGVKYCHSNGCKAYITLNSYFHDCDFLHFLDYLSFLNEIKVDAVICSDLAVVNTVKKNTTIAVHLSTQAFVLNASHAALWKELGVKRIVLGRELSIKQASYIQKYIGIETELFVHGAMCMSYSGHCTISNYTAGRDSNRGGCIQSCRHLYNIQETGKTKTLLSSKDLNGASFFSNFIKHKICAAKIEGRMKSELYLATCVRVYKMLKNQISSKEKEEIFFDWEKDLEKIPHRNYTLGSLAQKATTESVYNGTIPNPAQYKFLGILVFYDKKKQEAFLHCKNPIEENQSIEILGIEKNFLLDIKNLKNAQGKKINVANSDCVVSFQLKKSLYQKYNLCNGLLVRALNKEYFLKKAI